MSALLVNRLGSARLGSARLGSPPSVSEPAPIVLIPGWRAALLAGLSAALRRFLLEVSSSKRKSAVVERVRVTDRNSRNACCVRAVIERRGCGTMLVCWAIPAGPREQIIRRD
ncbi:hypothetical protein SRHO_G00184840 [Serrasalmus rhombeus]